LQDWNLQDWKMTDEVAGVEFAVRHFPVLQIAVTLSTALGVSKRIFAVLYVSIMGLTRCY